MCIARRFLDKKLVFSNIGGIAVCSAHSEGELICQNSCALSSQVINALATVFLFTHPLQSFCPGGFHSNPGTVPKACCR